MTRTFVLSDAKIIRKDTEAFWRHNWHLKDNCDHMQPVAYDYIPREPECWRATEEQLAPHRCWSETMPSRLNNRSHFFENNKRHMVVFATKDTWPVQIMPMPRRQREMSPRQIAYGLTTDGVPSPSGGAWTFQTINKILQNELLRRRLCEEPGQQDQEPQHRQARAASSTERADAAGDASPSHRRSGPLDAAQRIRLERASVYGVKFSERATMARRLHPFAELFRCAECGGKMIICGSARNDRRIACAAAWWKQQCPHSKSYSLARLTKLATENACPPDRSRVRQGASRARQRTRTARAGKQLRAGRRPARAGSGRPQDQEDHSADRRR